MTYTWSSLAEGEGEDNLYGDHGQFQHSHRGAGHPKLHQLEGGDHLGRGEAHLGGGAAGAGRGGAQNDLVGEEQEDGGHHEGVPEDLPDHLVGV